MDEGRHDAWRSATSYDAYMGRWSRRIAPAFLDWLAAPAGLDWLEVGCGTGALSRAILGRAPASLLAIDPSADFVAAARGDGVDTRAEFHVGDALALPADDASRDVVVSGLVLNFVPDRGRALAEMRRALRPGGRLGFYVWDYPGGGLQFLRAFWEVAAALDPDAARLTERARFPDVAPEPLTRIAREAGFAGVEHVALETETRFEDFADYWRPFTLGAGPAPGYCASLVPEARDSLRAGLEAELPRQADGAIVMTARAWAIRGRAP